MALRCCFTYGYWFPGILWDYTTCIEFTELKPDKTCQFFCVLYHWCFIVWSSRAALTHLICENHLHRVLTHRLSKRKNNHIMMLEAGSVCVPAACSIANEKQWHRLLVLTFSLNQFHILSTISFCCFNGLSNNSSYHNGASRVSSIVQNNTLRFGQNIIRIFFACICRLPNHKE